MELMLKINVVSMVRQFFLYGLWEPTRAHYSTIDLISDFAVGQQIFQTVPLQSAVWVACPHSQN
jgi:hypothetical protein